jgi:hypothetical protein
MPVWQCGAVVTKVNDAVVKLVQSEIGEMAAGQRCGGPQQSCDPWRVFRGGRRYRTDHRRREYDGVHTDEM